MRPLFAGECHLQRVVRLHAVMQIAGVGGLRKLALVAWQPARRRRLLRPQRPVVLHDAIRVQLFDARQHLVEHGVESVEIITLACQWNATRQVAIHHLCRDLGHAANPARNRPAQQLATEQAQRAGRPEEAPASADGFVDVASNRVRASLLLGEIARQSQMRLENRRVSEMLATIASTYEEPQKVIEMYQRDAQLMNGLRNRAMEDQVVDWVFSQAKASDQSVSFQQLMQPQA